MLQNLEWILALAGTVIAFLTGFITLITKLVKAIKARNVSQAKEALSEFAKVAVTSAEQIKSKDGGSLSGPSKLEYAVTQVKALAAASGQTFTNTEIVAKIEEVVELTKEVNAKTTSTTLTISGTSIKSN